MTASAVFPTQTKPDCKTLWGIDGLEQVVLRSKHPVTAIGGINVQNVRSVMEQGVEGVAVIGALHNAENVAQTTSQFIESIDSACCVSRGVCL